MQTEKTEKSPKDLAYEKATQLSEQLGFKVHPLVFKESDESPYVIGFIKEPSRQVKMALMDKAVLGSTSAAAQALDTLILKEHSDPRLYSEKSEDDNIYLGAALAVLDLIQVSTNQAAKKKN